MRKTTQSLIEEEKSIIGDFIQKIEPTLYRKTRHNQHIHSYKDPYRTSPGTLSFMKNEFHFTYVRNVFEKEPLEGLVYLCDGNHTHGYSRSHQEYMKINLGLYFENRKYYIPYKHLYDWQKENRVVLNPFEEKVFPSNQILISFFADMENKFKKVESVHSPILSWGKHVLDTGDDISFYEYYDKTTKNYKYFKANQLEKQLTNDE